MKIAAIILAGGRSSRFGAEKALAALGGRTLLERVAAHIAPGASDIAVNAPLTSETAVLARSLGYDVAPDSPDDAQGPLAGIKAALIWAELAKADLARLAPCDTPMLPADLYPRLHDALGDAPAIVAESADGLHPLCGIWRPQAHLPLTALMAGGRHPAVREALAEIGARVLAFPDPAAFANINTREDLARLEAQL